MTFAYNHIAAYYQAEAKDQLDRSSVVSVWLNKMYCRYARMSGLIQPLGVQP